MKFHFSFQSKTFVFANFLWCIHSYFVSKIVHRRCFLSRLLKLGFYFTQLIISLHLAFEEKQHAPAE